MRWIFILVAFLTISFAQIDLSTPGGKSILVTFASTPSIAEVYVSGTYLGTGTVQVRINADTPTSYKFIDQSKKYENYEGTVNSGIDTTISIALVPFGQSPQSSGGEVAESTDLQSQSKQERVKAFRNFFFEDSPAELAIKLQPEIGWRKLYSPAIVALKEDRLVLVTETDYVPTLQAIEKTLDWDESFFGGTDIAGVDVSMRLSFYDKKLYKMAFEAPDFSADHFYSDVKNQEALFTQIFSEAYGEPNWTLERDFLDIDSSAINYTRKWFNNGATTILGIKEFEAEYSIYFEIYLDSLSELAEGKQIDKENQTIKNAADEF